MGYEDYTVCVIVYPLFCYRLIPESVVPMVKAGRKKWNR